MATSGKQGRTPLATGLGLFSLALGAVEVAAPGALARTLGMEGNERLLRAYGWREIGAGLGILLSRDPTPWVWSRVAGDGLDLATMAAGMKDDNPQRDTLVAAMAAVAVVTVADVVCASGLDRSKRARRRLARQGGQTTETYRALHNTGP